MKKITKRTILSLFILTILLGVIHIVLPFVAKKEINKYLVDGIEGYTGSVSKVELAWWKGEYIIYDIIIKQKDGKFYKPFVKIPSFHTSIQWKPIFKKGEFVGTIYLESPELNFEMKNGDAQAGEGADWTEPLKKLTPITINELKIKNGKVNYLELDADPKIDMYVNNLSLLVTNIRNVEAGDSTLPSDVTLTGSSIGGGDLMVKGKMNFLKETPDMDFDIKLENVKIVALNDFFKKYILIDVEEGDFFFYSKYSVIDKQLDGYYKPIIENLKVVDFKKDIKRPLEFIWESIAGTLFDIFKNHGKDRFATKTTISGSLEDPEVHTMKAVFNVFKNAFVKVYRKEI